MLILTCWNALLKNIFSNFCVFFPGENLKPKHHFVQHYAHLIRSFGPLSLCSTIRFESKHSYFKTVLKKAKNFKNICKTLAENAQLEQAFHLSSHQLLKPEVQTGNVTLLDCDNLSIQEHQVVKEYFCHPLELKYSDKVVIDGQLYRNGQILALSFELVPTFGEICLILFEKVIPKFLVRKCATSFNEHLGMFSISPSDALCVVEIGNCADYYPLNAYKFKDEIVVPLKHWISLNSENLRQ